MHNQNMLVSIEDDSLDVVSGGNGLCIDPCKLVEGALALGADVVGKGVAAVEGALSCLPRVDVSLSVGVGAGCGGGVSAG